MKQQINLYQPPEGRRREPFGATHLVWGLAGLGLVLALASALLAWSEQRQQTTLAEVQAQQQQRQQQLVELGARLPPPSVDPGLERELADLEQLLTAKRAYLQRLQGGALGNGNGFAAGLTALARRPVKNLWLREIRFYGDGKLAFRGGVTDPEALPAFVSALGQEPVFQGREFRGMRLERDERNRRQLEFRLHSAGVEWQ